MEAEFLRTVRLIRQYLNQKSDEKSFIDLPREKSLEKLFQIFFDFYEFSPAANLLLDRNGRILAANLTLETFTGIMREKLIGRPLYLSVLEADRDILFLTLRKIFRTKKPASCELRLQKQSTSRPLWVRLDGIYDRDLEGRPACRSILVDIDRQKSTEADLARLAAIVQTSEDAVIRLDPTGIITDWNPAAERIYGYSAAEAEGRHIRLILPAERGAEGNQLIERMRRGEEIRTFETVRRTKDGRDIHISLTVSAIRSPRGELTAVATIEREISERKELEAERSRLTEELDQERLRLEAVFNQMPAGLYISEAPSGKIILNNKKAVDLLGHPLIASNDYRDYQLYGALRPDGTPYRAEDYPMTRTILQGEVIVEEEMIYRRGDGTITHFSVNACPVRDAAGRIFAGVLIFHDISHRKKAEKAVRLAQMQLTAKVGELEQTNQELSEYAYAVSHDLKAPLRAIRNYADFLVEDLPDSLEGEPQKYLKGLKKALGEAERLIEDLLVFSRIGRAPLESDPIEMPSFLNEVISLLRLPSDVEIVLDDNWPVLTVDRTLLMQIFQNLITNAVKFNDSEKKRIEVGWQDGQEDRIELFVRDNGIGIEPRYSEQIFRVFQRLHTQQAYEGTGIGLAVVKKATAYLGGRVRLESTPGEGSTFFVEIPRPMGEG